MKDSEQQDFYTIWYRGTQNQEYPHQLDELSDCLAVGSK